MCTLIHGRQEKRGSSPLKNSEARAGLLGYGPAQTWLLYEATSRMAGGCERPSVAPILSDNNSITTKLEGYFSAIGYQ